MNLNNRSSILNLVSIIFACWLCFFIKQSAFLPMVCLYTAWFGIYFYLGYHHPINQDIQWKWSVLCKLILVFAFPLASDDIYRYYWDGQLVLIGISPYSAKPEIIDSDFIQTHKEVYKLLNSKSYYSTYPPVLQSLFALCAFLSFKSIYLFSIFWKLILLAVDFGIKKYLFKSIQNHSRLYWWYMNPLVLFESFGNGHPELIMIFFLAGMIYYLLLEKNDIAALFLGLAASIKLVPIVLSIYILKYLSLAKAIRYILIAGMVFVITLLPILPYHLHFYESLQLYFSKFEFNGSLFEIWKAIDYYRWGFDNVGSISKYLSILILVWIVFLFIKQKKAELKALYASWFLFWMGYLLLSTTIHPWYILPLLYLSLWASSFWILIAWTYLIIFSYSWYSIFDMQYKYGLILLEYALLLILFIYLRIKITKTLT